MPPIPPCWKGEPLGVEGKEKPVRKPRSSSKEATRRVMGLTDRNHGRGMIKGFHQQRPTARSQ